MLTSEQVANDLKKLIGSFVDLSANVTRRKEDYIVYIKKADYISDILGIIGASQALLDFEGIKVNRSTRGEAQRISNCDNANVDRSLSARRNRFGIFSASKTGGTGLLVPGTSGRGENSPGTSGCQSG